MYTKDNTKNLFNLANSVAENFVSNNLSDYQGLRNYDYGPEKEIMFLVCRLSLPTDLSLNRVDKKGH